MSAVVDMLSVRQLESFTWRWPDGIESFGTGWSIELRAGGRRHHARHGLGARKVYGRRKKFRLLEELLDCEVDLHIVEAQQLQMVA